MPFSPAELQFIEIVFRVYLFALSKQIPKASSELPFFVKLTRVYHVSCRGKNGWKSESLSPDSSIEYIQINRHVWPSLFNLVQAINEDSKERSHTLKEIMNIKLVKIKLASHSKRRRECTKERKRWLFKCRCEHIAMFCLTQLVRIKIFRIWYLLLIHIFKNN